MENLGNLYSLDDENQMKFRYKCLQSYMFSKVYFYNGLIRIFMTI